MSRTGTPPKGNNVNKYLKMAARDLIRAGHSNPNPKTLEALARLYQNLETPTHERR